MCGALDFCMLTKSVDRRIRELPFHILLTGCDNSYLISAILDIVKENQKNLMSMDGKIATLATSHRMQMLARG